MPELKIQRVKAHNIMGVKDIDFNLAGHHLYYVGGKNGDGKSSALHAVAIALCGRRGCDYPDRPLRDGEDRGSIVIEMDGAAEWFNDKVTVARTFERKIDGGVKEQLEIISQDDEKAPTPQSLLNELYTHRGFDPLAFTRAKPAEQLAELRKVVDVDLDSFDERYQAVYDERRDVNRDLKRQEAHVESLPFYEDVPHDVVPSKELLDELHRQEAVNREIEDQKRKRDVLRDQHRSIERDIQSVERENKAAQENIARLQSQIEELQAEIEFRNEARASLQDSLAKNKQEGTNLSQAIESATPMDVDSIRKSLEELESINARVRENQQREKAVAALSEFKSKSQSLTDRLDEIKREKSNAIKKAEWPVEGLSFNGDCVLFEGIPFAQCSSALQIRVSIAMAAAANPKLSLLVIQHGECMDDDTLEIVEKIAKEKDYQLLVEFMTRDAQDEQRCQVIIEDGVSREPVAAP